jgi:hypothetical protein
MTTPPYPPPHPCKFIQRASPCSSSTNVTIVKITSMSATPRKNEANDAKKESNKVELTKIPWARSPEYTLRLVQSIMENAKIRDGLFFDPGAVDNRKANPSGRPKEHWHRELAKLVFTDLPGVDWENKEHVIQSEWKPFHGGVSRLIPFFRDITAKGKRKERFFSQP